MQSVEEILSQQGIEYLINANNPSEVAVRCFSGLHEDKNPSLSLNLEKGVFNCFACGFKGTMQQFFEGLGVVQVPQLNTKLGFRIKKLKTKLEQIRNAGEVRMPEPVISISHPFKGISAKTLKEFGAFFTDSAGLTDYVCVPIYQHRKLKFIEGRYKVLNSVSEMPKYLRKPAGASVADILFPLDAVKDFSHVILVEGLFDVLKLHELGYTNSLCIFGTQNFTPIKAKILDEYGCRKVTILMDGDNAGKQASQKIQKLLEQRNIETVTVNLPKDIDPGDFNEEAAEYFLGKLKENF